MEQGICGRGYLKSAFGTLKLPASRFERVMAAARTLATVLRVEKEIKNRLVIREITLQTPYSVSIGSLHRIVLRSFANRAT